MPQRGENRSGFPSDLGISQATARREMREFLYTEEQISVRREGPSLLVGQALRLVRRGAQPLHDGQYFFGKEGSLRRRLRHRLRLGQKRFQLDRKSTRLNSSHPK